MEPNLDKANTQRSFLDSQAKISEATKQINDFRAKLEAAPLIAVDELRLIRIYIEAAVKVFGTPEQAAQFQQIVDEQLDRQ